MTKNAQRRGSRFCKILSYSRDWKWKMTSNPILYVTVLVHNGKSCLLTLKCVFAHLLLALRLHCMFFAKNQKFFFHNGQTFLRNNFHFHEKFTNDVKIRKRKSIFLIRQTNLVLIASYYVVLISKDMQMNCQSSFRVCFFHE